MENANENQQKSELYGGCVCVEPVLRKWPPESPSLIGETAIDGGFFILGANESGQFIFQIARATESGPEILLEGRSCVVEMEPKIPLRLAVRHDENGFTANLNGTWILSPCEFVPERVQITSPKIRPPVDFSTRNDAARAERRRKYAALKTHHGQTRRSEVEIIEVLTGTLLQMQDAIKFVTEGREAYVDALAALLRKTIADQKVPLPLLQLVAAIRDKPLIVYARGSANDEMRPGAAFCIGSHCWPYPDGVDNSPMDLDVWLHTSWGDVGKGRLKHLDVIWSLGSTLGNHFDFNVHPIEGAMRRVRSDWGGKRMNTAMGYLLAMSETIIAITTRLLAEG